MIAPTQPHAAQLLSASGRAKARGKNSGLTSTRPSRWATAAHSHSSNWQTSTVTMWKLKFSICLSSSHEIQRGGERGPTSRRRCGAAALRRVGAAVCWRDGGAPAPDSLQAVVGRALLQEWRCQKMHREHLRPPPYCLLDRHPACPCKSSPAPSRDHKSKVCEESVASSANIDFPTSSWTKISSARPLAHHGTRCNYFLDRSAVITTALVFLELAGALFPQIMAKQDHHPLCVESSCCQFSRAHSVDFVIQILQTVQRGTECVGGVRLRGSLQLCGGIQLLRVARHQLDAFRRGKLAEVRRRRPVAKTAKERQIRKTFLLLLATTAHEDNQALHLCFWPFYLFRIERAAKMAAIVPQQGKVWQEGPPLILVASLQIKLPMLAHNLSTNTAPECDSIPAACSAKAASLQRMSPCSLSGFRSRA